MGLLRALLLWTTLLLTVQAGASSILIGPLWLENVHIIERENDFIYDAAGGKWVRVEISARRGSKARMTVFHEPVEYDGVPNNTRVMKKAAEDGNSVILSGRLNEMDLVGRIYRSASGGRLWVEQDQMRAELGYVESGLQPIAGGTMDLKGSRLWVRNLDVFGTRASKLEGTLEVTAWNRTLENADVAFAGGATATTTFTTDPRLNDGNVVLHVDMADGTARLWDASLLSPPATLTGPALTIGNATLTSPNLRASRIRLQADKGAMAATLQDLQGDAARATLANGSNVFEAEKPDVSFAVATTAGTHTNDQATFGPLTADDGNLHAATAHVAASGHDVISGAVQVTRMTLSPERVSATVDWRPAKVPFLSFLLSEDDPEHVQFTLSGDWNKPLQLGGAIDADAFAVGGFRFVDPLHFTFPPTAVSADIVVPISIKATPANGKLELSDATKTVMLTGQLRHLNLAGVLTLAFTGAPEARLDVPTNEFAFDVAGAVSTTPWLGSTKPIFTGAGIKASNPTPLIVSTKARSGVVYLGTDAMVVGDPVLKMGEAHPFRARATLNANAGATFGYCLEKEKLVLTRGDFSVDTASFQPVDADGVIDVGGVALTNPSGSIDKLTISIDRLANKGELSSGPIRLGGTHISRQRDLPNDVAFDGDVVSPLVISSLSGTPVFSADRLELTNLQARGISVSFGNANLGAGEAISVSKASATFSADAITSALELTTADSDVPVPVVLPNFQIASVGDLCATSPDAPQLETVRREYVTNGRFKGDGTLHIDGNVGNGTHATLANDPTLNDIDLTVSGRSDRLDGNGTAKFSGLLGTVRFDILTDANCEGGSLLRIPMSTQLATGGGAMTIDFQRGKAVARADLSGFAMALTSNQAAQCSGPWVKKVLVEAREGWTEGICPTWSEPLRRCRWSWSTPEVSYEYRSKAVVYALGATVALTHPYVQLKDKKTNVCSVGPSAVGPVAFVGGYYPELRGSVPIVSDVANALIATVAVTAESTIGTALSTGAGMLGSTILNEPVVNVSNCAVVGIW